jgi:hypothetical protein
MKKLRPPDKLLDETMDTRAEIGFRRSLNNLYGFS